MRQSEHEGGFRRVALLHIFVIRRTCKHHVVQGARKPRRLSLVQIVARRGCREVRPHQKDAKKQEHPCREVAFVHRLLPALCKAAPTNRNCRSKPYVPVPHASGRWALTTLKRRWQASSSRLSATVLSAPYHCRH